jgi:hypothetical protein
MTRAILAGTAAFLFSGAAAFAGGLAPPIQPITGGAVVGSNAAPSGTIQGTAPSGTIQSADASGDCPVVQPAVTALQGQGFTRIDVTTGGGQAQFNAMRGDVMGTYVYDCNTGALVSQNAVTASADVDRTPGVFVGGVAQAGTAVAQDSGAAVSAGQVSGVEATAAEGAGVTAGGAAAIGAGTTDLNPTLDVDADAGSTTEIDSSPDVGPNNDDEFEASDPGVISDDF